MHHSNLTIWNSMHSKPHNNSYCVFLGSHPDRVKMVGRMSLIIYFIVSACCLGPDASLQLDHLKLNEFKASQQFIQFIFGSHHDRVTNGGPDKSYHLFYSLCLLFRSWSIISIWPFETQCIQSLTIIHTVYFWVPPWDRAKIGGPDESYHLFYSLCLLFSSWSIIPTLPFETQCSQILTTIHTVYFWVPPW